MGHLGPLQVIKIHQNSSSLLCLYLLQPLVSIIHRVLMLHAMGTSVMVLIGTYIHRVLVKGWAQ